MPDIAPGQDGDHITYCRLCEAQCGLIAKVQAGRITHIGPDRAHPVSEGHLCVKGPAMAHITYDPDRVLRPLKRIGGPGKFMPVSWDEALDDIAARLTAITTVHGGNSLGMYVGNPAAFATLHYVYAAGFGAAFGSGKAFSPLHVDTGGKQLTCELIYGGSHRFTFPDLDRCDFLLMLGANPMVSHMSLISEPRALQKLQAIHLREGVVVIDPRRTETAQRFEHVPILPDSDAWLLGAMLNIIFAEGLAREQLLDARVESWHSLRDAVTAITPEIASMHCRVEPETIRSLARRFAAAPRAACYGRVGTNRGSFSTLTNVFIEALNLVTGRFGAEGGWIFGAGAFADSPLPPSLEYGAQSSRIGNIPLILGKSPGGEIADDILTPGEGQMRALIVDSGNPVLSHPGGKRTAKALQALELMVSLDFYVTETSKHAHYILPTTTFVERDDITIGWIATAPRPWLQHTAAVVPPIGDARHEYDIYAEILERAGRPATFAAPGSNNPKPDLFAVVDAMMAGRSDGLTLDAVKAHPHGLQLAEHIEADKSWELVCYPDQRPRLWGDVISGELARLAEKATPGPNELRLFGRRLLRSMNSWMHNDKRIVRSDLPTLHIHPDDAALRCIHDGQQVRVRSKTGVIEVLAELSTDTMPGSVNYPHGWGHNGGWKFANSLSGANVNELASSEPADWEAVSGIHLLDGILVEIETI